MPKTKDAFALERLYEDLYSIEGREFYPDFEDRIDFKDIKKFVSSTSSPLESFLLQYLDGGEFKPFCRSSVPTHADELRNIQLTQQRIENNSETIQRINRHTRRLRKYREQIFTSGNETAEQLTMKDDRVKILLGKYDWLVQLFLIFTHVLISDKDLQQDAFSYLCRKSFGARLRQARIKKKMSIEDVARQLGLSRTGYGYYELGQRDLPTPTIYRLATMFDVSTDWLFGLKN